MCDLRDSDIRKRLLTERNLDLKKAIPLAKNMESVQIQNKRMELEANNTFALRQNEQRRKCYRCDSETHLANNCRHMESICNKCKLKGHLTKVCRRNISSSRINAFSAKSMSDNRSDRNNQKKSEARCSRYDDADSVQYECDENDTYYIKKLKTT